MTASKSSSLIISYPTIQWYVAWLADIIDKLGNETFGMLRSSVFWHIMQLRLVCSYVSDQPTGSIFKGHSSSHLTSAWPLKMGLVVCPKTSVNKYQFTLRNTQKNEVLIYTAVESWNNAGHVSDVIAAKF